MTSTVTSLIELAVDHGLGFAFLIVAGQVLLDRLMPLEFIASRLVKPKGCTTPARGAHRRERKPRTPAVTSAFSPSPRHGQNKHLCFSE